MKWQRLRQVVRALIRIIPIFVIAQTAPAQQVVSAKAGLIYYTEGDVFLEGKEIKLFAGKYPQMQNGQILRTKQGRAELILAPNIFLRLGENSSLRMEQNVIVEAQLSLEQGYALIEIIEIVKGIRAMLRLSNGAVEVSKSGLYRVDANSYEIKAYGGEAMVDRKGKIFKVKSGKMVRLDESLKPSGFDVSNVDSFHQWAGKRSFDLYVASTNFQPLNLSRRFNLYYVPAAPQKQDHWQVDAVGWLYNSYYRMRFFSIGHYLQWSTRRAKELLSPPLFPQDPQMPIPAPTVAPSIKNL